MGGLGVFIFSFFLGCVGVVDVGFGNTVFCFFFEGWDVFVGNIGRAVVGLVLVE